MTDCTIRKRGAYYSNNGRVVSKKEQSRARKLNIPPAYRDVCVYPQGYKLQATAVDKKGTLHYYYSDKHKATARNARKNRAASLQFSKIKTATAKILARPADPDFDSALALRMISTCYMRSGGVDRPTGNVGALTLRKEHVKLGKGGRVSFRYPGKSGVERRCDIKDPVLFRSLRSVKKNYGRARLAGGATRGDVAGLLRKIHGNESLQLKDIRTAGAMKIYKKALVGKDKMDKRVLRDALKHTAAMLGHSPAVCKKFYTL